MSHSKPDRFSAAQWKSMAASLGVDAQVTTDAFGRPDVHLDRAAMRAFHDAAHEHGFDDIAAAFANALGKPRP